MKKLTLLLSLFFALALVVCAAPESDTPLRQGVDEFISKSRVLAPNPFGAPQRYTLGDMLSKPPSTDAGRRAFHGVLVRDAARLSAELAALVELAAETPSDRSIVGQISRVRITLSEATKDKAKVAEAARQLAALRK